MKIELSRHLPLQASDAARVYDGASAAERALILDDAFVLSRAGRLPASRAIVVAGKSTTW